MLTLSIRDSIILIVKWLNNKKIYIKDAMT